MAVVDFEGRQSQKAGPYAAPPIQPPDRQTQQTQTVNVPGYQAPAPTGGPQDQVGQWYQQYLGREGSPTEIQTHLSNLSGNRAFSGSSDPRALSFLQQQIASSPEAQAYQRRGSQPSSQGNGGNGGQFTDPIAGALESQAASRQSRLQNPPQGSGLNLYENALKDVSAQFQQGGFTPAEMEIFQTQALDPLEQLRSARKQQVMENIARRGLNPQSGIAQSMLADVDRQFDSLRSQQQRSIAGQAANERSSRMLQALQMLGNLAGSEEGRLDKAFSYAQVPMQLDDRAFGRGMSFYNAAGNPLSLINPLLNLGNLQQGRSDSQSEALGLIAALLLS